LISKDYAARRRQLISDTMKGSYGPGLEDSNHTIYLTVADKDGNMVSLIQSNSWLFGSLMVPDGLGFALQNRGNCTSTTYGKELAEAGGNRTHSRPVDWGCWSGRSGPVNDLRAPIRGWRGLSGSRRGTVEGQSPLSPGRSRLQEKQRGRCQRLAVKPKRL